MLPQTLLARLPKLTRLIALEHWWGDTRAALDAFDELSQLSLNRSDAPSDWRVERTPCRPSTSRKHGISLIAPSSTVLPNVTLLGDVVIAEGCEIGPNCTIFGPSIIGPNSYVGPNAEIRRSLVLSDLTLSHYSYLGHSVVGRDVNLAAGFTVAVRNLKRGTVHVKIGEQLADTGHYHFGAIIADGFFCAINSCALPGRVLVQPSFNVGFCFSA